MLIHGSQGVRNDRKDGPLVFLHDDVSASSERYWQCRQARHWARMFAGRLPGSAIDARLQTAFENADALTSPAALARALSLSPSRLRDIVVSDFGVPPSKLLQWLQLAWRRQGA